MLCMSSLLHSSFSLLINSLEEWFLVLFKFLWFNWIRWVEESKHTIIIMRSKTMFDLCGCIEAFELRACNLTMESINMKNDEHYASFVYVCAFHKSYCFCVYARACSVHRMACVYWSYVSGCAVFVIKIEWFAYFSDLFVACHLFWSNWFHCLVFF